MFSKKELIKKLNLAKFSGDLIEFSNRIDDTKTLFFHLPGACLKIIRILGLVYALHKKQRAPEVMRVPMSGLTGEIKQAASSDFPAEKNINEIEIDEREDTRKNIPLQLLIGDKKFIVRASKNIEICINIQEFINNIYAYNAWSILGDKFEEDIRKLFDYYCKNGYSSANLIFDKDNFIISYNCEIPVHHCVEWCEATMADSQIVEYFKNKKSLIENSYNYNSFNLIFSIVIGQIEKDYLLLYINSEIKSPKGDWKIGGWMIEANSGESFLNSLEDILINIYCHNNKDRVRENKDDTLSELKKMAEEENLKLSPIDEGLAMAFMEIQKNNKRDEERWESIMSSLQIKDLW